MLHEILLSLSGFASPLLNPDLDFTTQQSVLSKPERELLRTAGHLSELHRNLISYTAEINANHRSVICRATATAIKSTHLAAFQRKVLEVEDSILRKDAGLVGAYNIVSLTAIVGEFSGYTRRLEWLWELVQFMLEKEQGSPRKGADLINKLRGSLQTGYADIEETALSLVKVAETAWLKQVSAWVLYGRLPSFGGEDFFIQKDDHDELGYSIDATLLPSYVSASTASSMLFIGTSLNRVRITDPSIGGVSHLSSQLQELASLNFPLNTVALSRTITAIRLNLSRTTLQKLLPLEKIVEMLNLLRSFFLLGRGEFAMALTQQADEKIRGRWRRADNLAYEKRQGLGTVVVKEGEVAAVLGRTWAALGSMQSQHDTEEDEELELARGFLRLNLSKTKVSTPVKTKGQASGGSNRDVPFRNLLFSVPVVMTIQIPSPVDLFLATADVDAYSCINSYLLSIRRAHLRLTDLWKITSLRRHHPSAPRPPYSLTRGGMAKTRILRERWSARSSIMRSTWTTSSAAIFFLAETETYLQVEVVEGLWEDFCIWLTGEQNKRAGKPSNDAEHLDDEDVQMQASQSSLASASSRKVNGHHDPQTLAIAHRVYLRVLERRLLLTQSSFTAPLYELLIHIDHLVALIHRLAGIWASMDLEADEGVIDAFSNLEAEETDVKSNISEVEVKVKNGVQEVVGILRGLSVDSNFLEEMEGEETAENEDEMLGGDDEGARYRPKRIGGVDRLLMKLDFGGWFDSGNMVGGGADVDDF